MKTSKTKVDRKKEAQTHFIKTIAHPKLEDALYTTALNFCEYKDKWREEYLDAIKRIFVAAKDFSANTNQEISYIQFTMLRTNLLYSKVDFSCANVDGAIFTNTDLTGCKFKKEQLLHIDLSDEQRSEIITL